MEPWVEGKGGILRVWARGPLESIIALILLGLITRALSYVALVCLDRRKR